MAREAAKQCGKEIGILGDLPGPKLRLGDVEGGLVTLDVGSEVTITTEDVVGDSSVLPVSWEGLPKAVRLDGEVYLADGRIRLRVARQDRRLGPLPSSRSAVPSPPTRASTCQAPR